MLTEDYLMRMINLALAALLQAIGLRKAGQYLQAQYAVDQALEVLLGLRADLLKRLDDRSILETLTQQGKLDIKRLRLVADLFKEEGNILAAQDRRAESQQSYQRAISFYVEAAFSQPQIAPELGGTIEDLVQVLDDVQLPPEMLYSLFNYYEGTGDYARAEAMMKRLDRSQVGFAEMQAEMIAFYERLLEKPDAELSQGGMSREQVEQTLSELRRDA